VSCPSCCSVIPGFTQPPEDEPQPPSRPRPSPTHRTDTTRPPIAVPRYLSWSHANESTIGPKSNGAPGQTRVYCDAGGTPAMEIFACLAVAALLVFGGCADYSPAVIRPNGGEGGPTAGRGPKGSR